MSTREEKEKMQMALDNDRKERYARNKKLAELKASNQMLEDAKNNIREKWADDPIKMDELLDDINNAQSENIEVAKRQYNANENEMMSAEYSNVSKVWADKYEKRLEKRGITDEEVRNKEYGKPSGNIAIATANGKKEKKTPKPLSFFKKNRVKPDLGAEENTDGLVEIEQKNRKIVGEGYVPYTKSVNPDRFLKELSEKPENAKTDTHFIKYSVSDIKHNETELKMDTTAQVFDASQIPSNIQYDIIPLPSHGECYKGKQERIPVRYLTASDENIISSPNMYANGDLIDVILKRCILDKTFNVDEMCIGDRDAVLIWLRETGYGPKFPIVARNPQNGNEYNTNIDLSTLEYKPFNLKGDENGWFEYKTDNGDILKFKLLTNNDRLKLRKESTLMANEMRRREISRYATYIKEYYEENEMEDEESELLINAIDSINEWYANVESEDYDTEDNNGIYSKNITNQMCLYTMSVNGETDREFVESYINNMRSMDAIKYRNYVNENIPGVNMEITITIPESDGGGSFNTFLGIDDTVFINI